MGVPQPGNWQGRLFAEAVFSIITDFTDEVKQAGAFSLTDAL